VVFSSSLAVFGPADHPPPRPSTTDPAQPADQLRRARTIGEQLLADYTRKGFLRGRALRWCRSACVPASRTPPVSFMSGIIREPLAGARDLPGRPGHRGRTASPAKAIAGLRSAATASDQAWAPAARVTLPALTVSVADMAEALTAWPGLGQRAH